MEKAFSSLLIALLGPRCCHRISLVSPGQGLESAICMLSTLETRHNTPIISRKLAKPLFLSPQNEDKGLQYQSTQDHGTGPATSRNCPLQACQRLQASH